jgi:DNA polymerase III gamma/tau subunit
MILSKMLSDPKKCPHSFLIHGPTGCGKTTIARIIAKSLNCTDLDLIELNNADVRGIDTIREIIKNSQFLPMSNANRAWILDETHKLSSDAQNALLKVLEDTPQSVYFVLCTTDPQKLLPTIRGRCMQLQVKPLGDAQLSGLIKRIAREEGEQLAPEVIEQVVMDSLGHPRNAIQILEKVLNIEPDRRLEVAKQTAEAQSKTIELCRALMKGAGWKEVRSIFNGLMDQEPEDIRRAIMGYFQAVLLKDDSVLAATVLEEMLGQFNTGFPGLIYACFAITKSK